MPALQGSRAISGAVTPTTNDDGWSLRVTANADVTLTNSGWTVGRSGMFFPVVGSATVTFVAGASVTLRNVAGDVILERQYDGATALYTGTNEWTIYGSEDAVPNLAVTTGKLADGAVTLAKMESAAGPYGLGRVSGTGAPIRMTPAQMRAASQTAGPEMHYYSAVYGDWTGTPATDTANLIAAIAAWAGSTIVLPPRDVSTPVVLTETIEIPTRTILRGPGSSSLAFQLANGVNDDMFRTLNFATLTTTNVWRVSEGIPVGLGLEGVRLLGNKANNTAGSAFVAFCKRPWLVDVIVDGFAEHGFWLEAGGAGGQDGVEDLPEGWCHHLLARHCEIDGFHILGPHDNHFGAIYAIGCGQWGVNVVRAAALSDGDYMHVYSCGEGVYLGGRCAWGHIQSEANFGRGLVVDAGNVQVGSVYMFNNHRDHQELSDAPLTDIHLEVTGDSRLFQAGIVRVNPNYGGTGVSLNGLGTNVAALSVSGLGSTGVIRLVRVLGNTTAIGTLRAEGATVAGSIGIELAAGVDLVTVRGSVQNCATHAAFNTGGGPHTQCNIDLVAFANAGQTVYTGTLPSGTGSRITIASNDGIGTAGNYAVPGSAVGFFGVTPAARPTVTGSRGGNAALASVLTALANLGLITDSSTA